MAVVVTQISALRDHLSKARSTAILVEQRPCSPAGNVWVLDRVTAISHRQSHRPGSLGIALISLAFPPSV